MSELMRFPISQRDIDRGRLVRSARRLSKLSTTEMPIMFAHNVIANLLGYKDFQEIEQNTQNFPPRDFSNSWKRNIYASVIYRAHMFMKISINQSIVLTDRLWLTDYCILKKDYSYFQLYERFSFEPHEKPRATPFKKLSNIEMRRSTFDTKPDLPTEICSTVAPNHKA